MNSLRPAGIESAEGVNWPAIDGVERVQFGQSEKLVGTLKNWFDTNKAAIPKGEFLSLSGQVDGRWASGDEIQDMLADQKLPDDSNYPPEIAVLFDNLMTIAASDPDFRDRIPLLYAERTGDGGTNELDYGSHLDPLVIFPLSDGRHMSQRSLPKYMTYIGRPGSMVMHGKIDPSLSRAEGNAMAPGRSEQSLVEPVWSQLLPNATYKVAVGDLLHGAPPHEDGLMIVVAFNKKGPATTPHLLDSMLNS